MMTVQSWLETFAETIDGAAFRHAAAGAFAGFMIRYGAPVGSFVEGRRKDNQELVVLDFRTAAPQRPFHAVKPVERVGVLFLREDAQPLVMMLRDDFPDTEHQQLKLEGCPATICIDDRPWSEAVLTWTPAELVERILSWFRRAGRGELHDARQPVDPFLMITSLNFFIARSVLSAGSAQNLIALHDPTDRSILRVCRAEAALVSHSREPLSIFGYQVAPEAMKRLKYAPDNLASLAAMLDERGINLFGDLKPLLTSWIAEGRTAAWRLNGRFAVIVEMPVVSPRGEQGGGLDHRAFITAETAGDIAVALGIAEDSRGHGAVGYVMKVLGTVDQTALSAIKVQTAEVYLEFEPDLAAKLAGRNAPDVRKAVLVGAGAIGSHLADCLAREGRFLWTVIDDDKLLPHNLARHIAGNNHVTQRKAQIVADHINGTFTGVPQAKAITANLFADGQDRASIEGALREADLIIDATASVVAARHISDHAAAARRASVFFNPTGEAVVLLAEPVGRALTLRDLEAQYLGLVLHEESLAEHLGKEAETVAYTGACRAITNRIPQSRAAILSGLAALGLSTAVDADAAVISIWTLKPDGNVTTEAVATSSVMRFRARGWEIAVDAGLLRRIYEMREARIPVETGGLLFGLVDIPAKHIHLVDASPAPLDSVERPTEFVRGVEGVDELMDSVRRRTMGQVRYVGEWHSHPPRASARPSATDGRQIDWLAALMGMDSMPALMLIAAERETAVILADEQAQLLPQDRAA
jgi:Prokaryotic E2 family A/ThiF family/Prokaryotic homologs of the JAB domain